MGWTHVAVTVGKLCGKDRKNFQWMRKNIYYLHFLSQSAFVVLRRVLIPKPMTTLKYLDLCVPQFQTLQGQNYFYIAFFYFLCYVQSVNRCCPSLQESISVCELNTLNIMFNKKILKIIPFLIYTHTHSFSEYKGIF